MRKTFIVLPLLSIVLSLSAQKTTVLSPNRKIIVELFNTQGTEKGEWFLKVKSSDEGKTSEVIPQIALGLNRSDQDFSKELKFLKAGKILLINEEYTAIHGKRSQCSNSANEVVVAFENPLNAKMNLILRAYNDGVAFRYEFPEKSGSFVMKDELTAYSIPDSTKRWLQKFNPANEGIYTFMKDGEVQQDWAYPALFNTPEKDSWYLIHEADLDRNYCGTKLSNVSDKTKYKLIFPDQWNGRGKGESLPTISLPWKSPWRVIIAGSLADIVESTLVDDVCPPSVISQTGWIKPGVASWNYWSDNHGTRSYKTVCAFADLAAGMGWPYTLLDWEWDSMGDGGKLEDALTYIHSKGIKPLMWYNSGGDHTWVGSTPKDRMLTHENRIEEFTKLKKLGVVGVKIDFFESEKQDMIKYYLDILDDAAKFEMLVYFHGCLVPRGWARTYPNLMTYEGVRGAEWYNNGPEFTTTAPEHNTILPFTRNVVGAMDYTPVTFTNSQFPHITTYGHELALSVLFESGVQHFADRPEGYYTLPDAAKTFLKNVPNSWDNTKLLEGYPGKDIIIARQKDNEWYIGGINADNMMEKRKKLSFNFLPEGVKYKLILITDGKHDKEFYTQYLVVNKTSSVDVKLLRRGGFAACLSPMN
ncbi:glycoside hydrolase family 97 protein [Dysgonomonas termitidis]|uniref:Glycoside hydrolase family 97 catalytic domain-containing protein n=1 Tax=Dysgonomonas termitidis TaxID=1516126 RepID=A0ABV9KQP6_9BACT